MNNMKNMIEKILKLKISSNQFDGITIFNEGNGIEVNLTKEEALLLIGELYEMVEE